MNKPYYILPIIQEYRLATKGSDDEIRLRKILKVNIGDPVTLERILRSSDTEDAPIGSGLPHRESTIETIDNFLDKFSPRRAPDPIVAAIKKEENNELATLRQLIKNQQYTEALEIIEQGNLKNPEKNIYFADQIRFLKKLISIERHKK